MTIYGRFHSSKSPNTVTVLRVATLEDVVRLDDRRPDKTTKKAVELGSYVVVTEDEEERLYHVAYLRADGGWDEISDAIEAAKTAALVTEQTRHDVAASVARHAGLDATALERTRSNSMTGRRTTPDDPQGYTDSSKVRFETGQFIKEGTSLGLVLQSGKKTYDVVWTGGSTSRYWHGKRDVRLADMREVDDHTAAHLRKEVALARAERGRGARIKRGQVWPSR